MVQNLHGNLRQINNSFCKSCYWTMESVTNTSLSVDHWVTVEENETVGGNFQLLWGGASCCLLGKGGSIYGGLYAKVASSSREGTIQRVSIYEGRCPWSFTVFYKTVMTESINYFSVCLSICPSLSLFVNSRAYLFLVFYFPLSLFLSLLFLCFYQSVFSSLQSSIVLLTPKDCPALTF